MDRLRNAWNSSPAPTCLAVVGLARRSFAATKIQTVPRLFWRWLDQNWRLRTRKRPTNLNKVDKKYIKPGLKLRVCPLFWVSKSHFDLLNAVRKLFLCTRRSIPLGPEQMLLRGAMLRNTQWIYGVAVYTGHESKLMKNAKRAPLKMSNMDRTTNMQVRWLVTATRYASLRSGAVHSNALFRLHFYFVSDSVK